MNRGIRPMGQPTVPIGGVRLDTEKRCDGFLLIHPSHRLFPPLYTPISLAATLAKSAMTRQRKRIGAKAMSSGPAPGTVTRVLRKRKLNAIDLVSPEASPAAKRSCTRAHGRGKTGQVNGGGETERTGLPRKFRDACVETEALSEVRHEEEKATEIDPVKVISAAFMEDMTCPLCCITLEC